MTTAGTLVTRFRKTIREEDSNNSHFSDTEIIRWFSIAQQLLTGKTGLIVNKKQRTTVADLGRYPLPDGFKTMLRVLYDGEKLTPVTRRQLDNEDDDWENNTTGSVEEYFVEDGFLFLYKKPSTTGKTIQLLYYGITVPLEDSSSTISLPAALEDALVSYALMRGFKKLKDRASSDSYREEWDEIKKLAKTLAYDTNRDLKMVMRNVSEDYYDKLEYNRPETYGGS